MIQKYQIAKKLEEPIGVEEKEEILDLTKRKTTGANRNILIIKKLEIIDYAKAYGRNLAAKKFDLAGRLLHIG